METLVVCSQKQRLIEFFFFVWLDQDCLSEMWFKKISIFCSNFLFLLRCVWSLLENDNSCAFKTSNFFPFLKLVSSLNNHVYAFKLKADINKKYVIANSISWFKLKFIENYKWPCILFANTFIIFIDFF